MNSRPGFFAPFVLIAAIVALILLSPLIPAMPGADAGPAAPAGVATNTSGFQPSPGAIIVAAADSSADMRSLADYLCDGVEDQREITAALGAAGSGGEVFLAGGHYFLDETIAVPSYIALRGQGDSTVLDFLRGGITVKSTSCSLSDLQFTGSGYVNLRGARNVALSDITASRLDNTDIAAFHLEAYGNRVENVTLENCRALDCNRWGFVIAGSYFEEIPGIVKNVSFLDCQAINCGRYGQYAGSSEEGWDVGFSIESSAVENITFARCLASGSWESGFHVEDVPCVNVVLTDCISRDNGQKYRTGADSPDFYAGYVVGAGMRLVNCTSENNVRGFYCNNRGGELIRCTDTGSDEGYVILRQSEGLRLSSCSAVNSGLPVNIWAGCTHNIVIDTMIISATKPRETSAISVARTAEHPEEILIKNSVIRGYRTGITNSAESGGRVRVEDTRVIGATVDFVNCDVVYTGDAPGTYDLW